MAVVVEAIVNPTAELLSHVSLRTLRRVAGGVARIAAYTFYWFGRGLLKLVRAPRSATGVPEAIFGFLVVMGLVTALIKLPLRLVLATFIR